jgi:mRNA-degrading endonuclease RelE of RelBE toxin-antitoxin system
VRIRKWTYLAVVVLLSAGCSSSKQSTDDDTYHLAAFEDFDAEAHPDVIPPPPPVDISHDIPGTLEQSGESSGKVRVRGYRVQVYASRDKRMADEQSVRAIEWWERTKGEQAEDTGQPPVYVEYEQPYYKIRIGDYRSRTSAASDADRLSRIFQGAFVVPATIIAE